MSTPQRYQVLEQMRPREAFSTWEGMWCVSDTVDGVIIADDLPAQQAGHLARLLNEGEEAKKEVARLQNGLDELQERLRK